MTPRDHVPTRVERFTARLGAVHAPSLKRQQAYTMYQMFTCAVWFSDQYFDHRPGNIEAFMQANASHPYAYERNWLLCHEDDAALLWLTLGGRGEN